MWLAELIKRLGRIGRRRDFETENELLSENTDEVNTPLSGIIGFREVLLMQGSDKKGRGKKGRGKNSRRKKADATKPAQGFLTLI